MSEELITQGWTIKITTDHVCLDCLIEAARDQAGGFTINEQDKMILIMNYVLVPSGCDFVDEEGHAK